MNASHQITVPIYLIGDSHVLPFSNLLLRDDFADRTFLSVVKFCGGVKSSKFFDAEKKVLDPRFVSGLASTGLVGPEGAVSYLSQDPGQQAVRFAMGEPQIAPLLVVSCGEQDARGMFLREFDPDCDFRLPADAPDYGFDSAKKEIDYAVVHQAAQSLLNPYLEGLKFLAGVGFRGLVVLNLPPPASDDDVFEKLNGFRTSRSLRYKIYWVFNHILATFCAKYPSIISFLDLWPDVTRDGIVKPEYELDGTHLNRRAAQVALEKVVNLAIANGLSANHVRYSLAKAHVAPAEAKFSARDDFAAMRASYGERPMTTVQCDPLLVKRVCESLVFDSSQTNARIAFDWSGRNYLNDTTPHLRSARVSQELMPSLYSLLYSAPVRWALEAACGGDYIVYSVRPRKTTVTGPQPADEGWHTDGCPPGIIRGILYCTDVDESSGPFQYQEDGKVFSVHGPAGTLILFDADRWRHRGSKAISRERIAIDLVIGPRIPAIPRMVIHAGNHPWPGDPFQFSLSGMCVFPDMNVDQISANPITGMSNVKWLAESQI